jgi:hypothetical protein
MLIEGARMAGNELILKTKDAEARRRAYDFKPGEYELRKITKKRSIDANAYCWKLINELAECLNKPPKEIYREAIRDIGGNSEVVCVKNPAVKKLRQGWERNGIGWQTETFQSKIDGCTNVILYYGSSVYDTKQMSQLIDVIVQECKEQGIETKTPNEIAKLKALWESGETYGNMESR